MAESESVMQSVQVFCVFLSLIYSSKSLLHCNFVVFFVFFLRLGRYKDPALPCEIRQVSVLNARSGRWDAV